MPPEVALLVELAGVGFGGVENDAGDLATAAIDEGEGTLVAAQATSEGDDYLVVELLHEAEPFLELCLAQRRREHARVHRSLPVLQNTVLA